MIEYIQFKEPYGIQVQNLIYNIMKSELQIEEKQIINLTKDLQDIQKNYINNGGNFWTVIDTEINEVLGTVSIKKIDNNNAEFKRFYVKEGYRNKHIGYELYKIAESFSKDNKFKCIYLVSGDKSEKARQIYNKNGWRLTDKNNSNVNIFVREGAELYKKDLENI